MRELCVGGGGLAPAEGGQQLLITLHWHGGEVLALILTLSADCHGVPPCVSRSATRSRQLSCPAGCRGVGRSKAAFCLLLSRRTNTWGERGELLSRVRYSDADRDPGGSYGGAAIRRACGPGEWRGFCS